MKGYALLIGTTKVDTEHYTGQMSLPYTQTDVTLIKGIIDATGLYAEEDVEVLTEEKASTVNFLNRLEIFAEKSKHEEGFLVVFFSGHGASFPYTKKKNKEFICFYDRMLLENEMRKYLCEIQSGLKVFFILNSCFSSGMSELALFLQEKSILRNILDFEGIPQNISALKTMGGKLDNFGDRLSSQAKNHFLGQIQEHQEHEGIIESTYESHDFYKDLIETYKEDYLDYQTEICFLNSCKKTQRTEIGSLLSDPSFFPQKVELLWNKYKKYAINYIDFANYLKEEMRPDITPSIKIYPEGKENETIFARNQPFFFEQSSKLTLKPKATMETTIDLTENHDETPVGIKVTNGYYRVIDSGTYSLLTQQNDTYVHYLVGILGADLEADVEYIGVVEVRSDATHSDFTDVIGKMVSSRTTGSSNGLIILHDSSSATKIKGKKRTAGRVTNVMG